MDPAEAAERLEAGDASLRELALDEVDARLVRALEQPSCLESLTLGYGVDLDRDLAAALAKQTQLAKLGLWYVRLGDGAASHLAAALRMMTRLETVRLGMYEGSEDDVKCVFATVGQLPQLGTLKLGGRAIAVSFRSVADALVEPRLRELDVSDCPIGDDEVAHLAAMLERNRSLSVLYLRGCGIGDAGLEQLGRALTHNTTLRRLTLLSSSFTAEGVVRFANLMGIMNGLQVLEIDNEWTKQLLLGVKRNYSLLEVPRCPAAQPYLDRNARGYTKARAATLAWLCVSRFHRPFGLLPDIGLIIAHLIHASRGRACWIEERLTVSM